LPGLVAVNWKGPSRNVADPQCPVILWLRAAQPRGSALPSGPDLADARPTGVGGM